MRKSFDAPADLGSSRPINSTNRAENSKAIFEAIKSACDGRHGEIIAALTPLPADVLERRGQDHPCAVCGGHSVIWPAEDATTSGRIACRTCTQNKPTGDIIATIKTFGQYDGQLSAAKAIEAIVSPLSNDVKAAQVADSVSKSTGHEPRPNAADIDDGTADLRHKTYTKLANIFPLSDKHRKQLNGRGMTDAEIDHRGYWSSPASATVQLNVSFLRAVRDEISKNVPGVFPGGAVKLSVRDALMIPVRDVASRIVAIKCRPGKQSKKGPKYLWLSSKKIDGPSPGSPCHVPLLPIDGLKTPIEKEVRVTEGPLKADLATSLSGKLTLGVGGATIWKSAVPIVESIAPEWLHVAMDADADTNQAVAAAVIGLCQAFPPSIKSKLSVGIETWKTTTNASDELEPKGIDDVLVSGTEIDLLIFTDAKDYIEKLREVANAGGIASRLHDLRDLEEPHDPARLARVNLHRYREDHGGELKFWQGRWWRYKTGCWQELSTDEADAKVRVGIDAELFAIARATEPDAGGNRANKKCINNNMVKNVISAMRAHCLLASRNAMPCWLPEPQSNRQLLSLSNCLLDVDAIVQGKEPADAMLPHSPDWFSGTQVNYEYDSDCQASRWHRYLETSLPDESSRRLAQEWAGYLLTTSNPFQRFLACEGDGGTGKSVYAAGLTAMLSEQSVSNADLGQFGTQFGLSKTIGKALNVDSDVNINAKFAEGTFKKFCIGERMDFQLKGGDPFSQTPTAKVLLCWNERPQIKDTTNAFWRRMLVLHFTKTIAEADKVKDMDKPWWWAKSEELPGILNWAIEGLRRLHEQGGFTVPESMKTILRSYRRDMNPVQAFIADVVVYDPNDARKTSTQSIVAAFRTWCIENSDTKAGEEMEIKVMGRAIAKKFDIESFRIAATISETGKKIRGFKGIFLNDKEEKINQQPALPEI